MSKMQRKFQLITQSLRAASLAALSLTLSACGGSTAQTQPGTAAASGGGSNAPAAQGAAPPQGSISEADLAPIDKIPAEVLDLTNWKITLPFGEPHHPTEIKQPALKSFKKDEYFYVSEKGVVFKAHAGGVTTPNSSYPRTELREMANGGHDRAAWSSTKGRHTMMYTATITGIPVAKPHVVAGQVHDAKDDVVMIRLERKHLFVEGGGNNLGTLDDNYELGTPFSIILDVSDGRVRVYYNGESTPRVDIEREVEGCYFKLGAYVQSNPSKGDKDTAAGQVVVSSLQVHHQD